MAIFGPIDALRAQATALPRLRVAWDHAAKLLRPDSPERARIFALRVDESVRVDLEEGMFAVDMAYLSKPRPEGFFESHRKYIDVQVMVEGEELMEVEDISRLVVSQPYREERDFIKYADTDSASRLVMRAGDVAVFYPTDGHMPSLQPGRGPGLVRKTVVKVPV